MISRRVWLLIGLIVLAYSIGLAADLSPLIRGQEEWRWQLAAIPHWDQLWPIGAALILIAAFVVWIDRRLQEIQQPILEEYGLGGRFRADLGRSVHGLGAVWQRRDRHLAVDGREHGPRNKRRWRPWRRCAR